MLASVTFAMFLAGCEGGASSPSPDVTGKASSEIRDLQTFDGLSRTHVTGRVDYAPIPPVGGDHARGLQTCGAYDEPISNELGVHSMEHGAVWLTYRPDLPASEVDQLRRLSRQPYVLVTPYQRLPAPVVASAWGRQLRLDSAADERLEQFVSLFRNGPQAPEPGAVCVDQGSPLPTTGP